MRGSDYTCIIEVECRMTLEDLIVLPQEPGCYLFYQDQTVIYIGKAVRLNQRVRSYFSEGAEQKAKTIRQSASHLEFITTKSEREALVLEANLISQHQPRFNIRLKDDKSYPFLKLSREAFPTLLLARKVVRDGSLYFGPYPNAGAVRRMQDVIYSIFPLRQNSGHPMQKRKKACLRFHMGRCLAPCLDEADSKDYQRAVEQVKAFLEGKVEDILTVLEEDMKAAAARQDFELAKLLRDRIQAEQNKSKHKNGVSILERQFRSSASS